MIVAGPIVFSSRAYAYLAREVSARGGFEAGAVEVKEFPDGERYQRIVSDVRGRDVAVVGGTIGEADTLEIFDLCSALVSYGARSLTLAIPYFGYSTMERAVRPGEVVTAKSRARLFSAIPLAPGGNRVLLVDVHTEGLPHYFEGGVTATHVYAKTVVQAAARRLGGAEFVLACTDAGRAKWVESLANDLGVAAAFVFKRRLDGERTEISGVSADVRARRVVIYDDMIRTGGSLMNAARAYRQAGATGIAAIATHGLFPGDALRRIEESGLFDAIVCTDSHPRAVALQGGLLAVETIASLLAAELVVR